MIYDDDMIEEKNRSLKKEYLFAEILNYYGNKLIVSIDLCAQNCCLLVTQYANLILPN